jgi:hypothetical protein
VLPDLFQRTIAGLDELQLAELVGGLLRAEVNALGLLLENFIFSTEVKVGDEGLDAEIRGVAAGTSSFLPEGDTGFQFKSVRGSIADLKLKGELNKPGPRRILEGGGTYLLAWNKELNPKQERETREELEKHASAIVDNPKLAIWGAAGIARLCARYPGVPQAQGLLRLGPVISHEDWKRILKVEERPFFPDEQRAGLIEEIRRRLASGEGGLIARIIGDSGIGKTRTVAEALDLEDLSSATFYAPTSDHLEDFLSLIRGNDDLRAILVVDEVDALDLRRLEEQVAAAAKNVQLITIGLPSARRTRPSRSDLELGHLSSEAMTELVKAEGLVDERTASFVADATEGYPQMAFEILDEIRDDPEVADVSKLAQTRGPRQLMEKAVPEEFRKPLGVLALFHSVGCSDELEPQLDELAAQFPVTGPELRRTISDAEGRYIRIAGRRCYVRPKLVATWLASEIIEEHGADVITWIESLSPGLQGQFMHQLENFGSGPSGFRDVLGKFIAENKRFRQPEDFDEAAGRFLHAAAAVAPVQVVSSIRALVCGASAQQLKTLPRRDLVWALEYLLWFPETYVQAIQSLFVLAEHESETWGNNATGEFIESFQLSLGGTMVPHGERLDWVRGQLEDSNPDQLLLIAKAAAAGLNSHQSRMSGGSKGAIEPRDWQPASEEEYRAALEGSLELLLDCVDRAEANSPVQQEVVALFADRLRVLVSLGLIDSIEAAIGKRKWSELDRANLAGSLRDIRRYDEPPPQLDTRIVGLIESLLGSSFEERLQVVLATKPWDLLESDDWNATPPAVDRLVNEIVEQPELLQRAIEYAVDAPEEGSQFQLFMHCAAQLGPEAVGDQALGANPPAWEVLAAALTQVRDEGQSHWADRVLTEVLANNADRFPAMLRAVGLSHDRVSLVLGSITEGKLNGDDFAELLYGAPIGALDQEDALALIEAIGANSTGRGIESALGMLHQWAEAHRDQLDARVIETTSKLLLVTAGQEGKTGTMSAHYLERLLKEIPVDFDVKIEIWSQLVLHADIGDSGSYLWLFGDLLKEDPAAATEAIFRVLDQALDPPYPRWAYPLEDGKLLSVAASETEPTKVWKWISNHDDRELRYLLRHTRWSGDEPDALVREFLLSERLSGLEDEAFVNFSNSLGVVSGPFHLATERERDRARSWLTALEGSGALEWAKRLVSSYESRLERDRLEDEEEDVYFR